MDRQISLSMRLCVSFKEKQIAKPSVRLFHQACKVRGEQRGRLHVNYKLD